MLDLVPFVIRVALVTLRALAVLPPTPAPRVVAAAIEAVRAEVELGVPAEVTMPIAQHESDDQPCAVTFVRADGSRLDSVVKGCEVPAWYPPYLVCGYLQAMAHTREACSAMMRLDGGMRAGAAELVEWLATCRGDLACALRGHAGGTSCALDRASCAPASRAFADIFYARARAMGWRERQQPRGST